MNNRGMHAAIRDFQTLIDEGTVAGLSDGQLLDRFVTRREDAVFQAIVHRHGPMVWRVCRRVLLDHHDAEDAFQATFLVLARKASSVVPRENVGPWLHGVASQTARKARATRARRRLREAQPADLPEPASAPEKPGDDLLVHLDRELSRLPERYRAPIVLCALEQKSHIEAARQLGWPIGTVSGRLSRARTLLAARLSRPGLTLSSGALAALLAQDTASAGVPAPLIAATAQAASRFAAGRTLSAEVVSATVGTLTNEVLNSMFLSKLKFMAAVLVAGVALAAGGTTFVLRAHAAGAPGIERSQIAPKAEPPRAEAPPPVVAAPIVLAQATARPADPPVAAPYTLDPDAVYELPELTVDRGTFHLKSGPVAVVPLNTERGITGAMVIGNGTYRYTPEKDKVIEGHFRATMLRFSPAEQAAILPLAQGKKLTDRGATEMSKHLLLVVKRHCWHSGQDVLIPPKGAFAAVLYSREHGDLLISADDRTGIAYGFTDRKALYEKK